MLQVGNVLLDRIIDHTLGSSDEPPSPKAVARAPAVPFGEVVRTGQLYNVSRTFSAMLLLINNGNVLIERGARPEEPFSLKLAKLEKHENVFNKSILAQGGFLQATPFRAFTHGYNPPLQCSQGIVGMLVCSQCSAGIMWRSPSDVFCCGCAGASGAKLARG